MGMTTGSGGGGPVSDINVTPLVDVMLCLLIIMMVVAPMLQTGVSVALPKSKNPDPDPNIIKETSAVVAIPNDGEFYIGRDKVAQADIPRTITKIMKDKPPNEQVVYIKSSKQVQYGTVVQVIDAIRDAGFEKIGLVSEKERAAPAAGGGQQ